MSLQRQPPQKARSHPFLPGSLRSRLNKLEPTWQPAVVDQRVVETSQKTVLEPLNRGLIQNSNWPMAEAGAGLNSPIPCPLRSSVKLPNYELRPLTMLLWNCRGLGQSSFNPKRLFIRSTGTDVVLLNEQWTSSSLPGFSTVESKDSETETQKINSSILIKDNLNHKVHTEIKINNTILISHENLLIILTYMRPGMRDYNEEIVFEIYKAILDYSAVYPESEFILAGDLNRCNDLIESCLGFILPTKLKIGPTHTKPSSTTATDELQIVYTSRLVSISHRIYTETLKLSDHAAICLSVEGVKKHYPKSRVVLPNKDTALKIKSAISNGDKKERDSQKVLYEQE